MKGGRGSSGKTLVIDYWVTSEVGEMEIIRYGENVNVVLTCY